MNTLYAILHWLLIPAYIAAPLALLLLTASRLAGARRRRAAAPDDAGDTPQAPEHSAFAIIFPAIATIFAGASIGLALALVYAQYIAGSMRAISAGQLLLSAYAGIGLIAILKGFDWLLQYGLKRLRDRFAHDGPSGAALMLFARLIVLVLVLLPFSMAATMTFRPKVVPEIDPMTEIGARFERVEFVAADGTRLVGWWIPALKGSPRADETMIVVHGLGSGKADALPMASAMRVGGYNVLAFDLRAHGESGGQFTSFGVNERRDVEAAAAWVKANHPEASRRLLGLGASMGAAAMLAARDETGHSPFEAMAVLGTYDDLDAMARTVIRRQFWGPMATIARWTAIPAASAHAGCDLAGFRPADFARDDWPSPVLVGHGQRDEIIPFNSGVRLYNATLEPKRSLWVPELGHNQVLTDVATMQAVLKFFEDSNHVPRGVV